MIGVVNGDRPFGMQMPGSSRRRRATPNVYSGMLLGAVICLGAAVGFMLYAGMRVGPGGDLMGAFKLHPESGPVKLGK